MKTIVKKILALVLVPILAMGQTGIAVHQLYCLCKGEVIASLFQIEPTCKHDEQLAQLPPCCRMALAKESCQILDDHGADHQCNDSNTDYFQLDEEAIAASFSSLDQEQAIAPAFCFCHAFDWPEAISTECYPPCFSNPPPRLYGKAFRIRVQSYLC